VPGNTSGANCERSLRSGAGKGITDGLDMDEELTRRLLSNRSQVVCGCDFLVGGAKQLQGTQLA
jgi:hypothetical protein